MRRPKSVPRFKNEEEERRFWATHDSADYVEWNSAKRAKFPNLKPSSRIISLRLPEALLNDLKILANKRDVPYQSLMKILLSEKIEEELTHK